MSQPTDDRMIMLPLTLVQRMVNALNGMPFGTAVALGVPALLNELAPYKAEQPGLPSIPTDPPEDPDPPPAH